MKITNIILSLLLVILSISCKESAEKPSIKDNSTRQVEEAPVEDYSDIPADELHKHILAHYDLRQYKIGKSKLKVLIESRPDLIDSLNLEVLQNDFDLKLSEIKQKEEALIERERKMRMPNATKRMKTSKENGLTIYEDTTTPEFDSTESFHAYYTKDNVGVLKLYLKIRYIDTQWLNIESYIITVDQLDYDLTGPVEQIETRGKKKYKHEILNVAIDTVEKLELINAVASGENATAVYVGKSAYKKRDISKDQQLAIRNVIDAYLFEADMTMGDLKTSLGS